MLGVTTIDVLVNIGCSLTASLVFLFIVLILFRPYIKISPFVCKSASQFEGEKTVYFIKIVNHSWFTAYDIKVELQVLEKYAIPPKGMMNIRLTPLTLVSDYLSDLAGYRPQFLRKEADHCIRFRTEETLDKIVVDDFKSVEVKVTLRHGLTGLVKVYSQEYSDASQIKNGKFTYGTSFGVLN